MNTLVDKKEKKKKKLKFVRNESKFQQFSEFRSCWMKIKVKIDDALRNQIDSDVDATFTNRIAP